MDEIQNSFCCGGLYGFIAAGVIGAVFNRIRVNRLIAQSKNSQLDNFPDSMQPDLTAAGIMNTSWGASVAAFFWSLFLIFFVGLVGYGVIVILS